MKESVVMKLDENDNTIVDTFSSIGIDRHCSKILVMLSHVSPASSIEIQHALELSQPVVSNATRYLIRKGWVKSKPVITSKSGRGNPSQFYSLSIPLKAIISQIEKDKIAERNQTIYYIERLKKMIK